MRKGLIYKITNKINQKVYIGQTVRRIEVRFERHIKDAKYGSELPIHRAIRKYGDENFKCEILSDDVPLEQLDQLEIQYIKDYKSINENYGYNVASGGYGGRAARIISETEVIQIYDLLSYTTFTLGEIGSFYSLSRSAISDINRGKSWKNSSYIYPIRNNGRRKILNNETVEEIINDLLENEKSTTTISKQYEINISTVNDIINGKIHRKDNLNYPLRERSNRRHKNSLRLSERDVLEIIDLLKFSPYTIKDIAKFYQVSETTIADIDKGRSWKEVYNGIYPIRQKK